jgi:hypothetical protein
LNHFNYSSLKNYFMLTIISKKAGLTRLAALATCAMLLSFSTGSGGEGFEIYLNNKVVLQQFLRCIRCRQRDDLQGERYPWVENRQKQPAKTILLFQ